jgi:hypothetical protein
MEGHRRRALYLIIAIGALALASISAQAADTRQELENSSIEPPYVEVPKDHIAMRRAVIEARKTVGEFIAALKHPAPGQQDFEVKKQSRFSPWFYARANEIAHKSCNLYQQENRSPVQIADCKWRLRSATVSAVWDGPPYLARSL